jgi:predicted RNase H-like HicB family nuclease
MKPAGEKVRSRRKTSKKKPRGKLAFPVILEKDEDGYFVHCPSLQGCYTQGDTYEEALTNIADAIRLHVEDRLANGESIPLHEQISLTTVEVQL